MREDRKVKWRVFTGRRISVWFFLWLCFLLLPENIFCGTVLQGRATGPDERFFREFETAVRAHHPERAEELLDKYLPAGASTSADYFRVGKVFFENQDWLRAQRYIEKCLQLDQNHDQAHLLLGLTLRQLKKPDEAEGELLTAARLNPQSDVNAYFAGHQLLLDGKAAAALPYFYRAAELNPRGIDTLRALGMTQARLGNYGLAESYYRRALLLAGESGAEQAPVLTDLAFLLLLGHDEKKIQEATQLAKRVVELQAESAAGYYLLGKALLKLGQAKDASHALETAIRITPDDSKPHFLLARAYDQLGEKAKAEKERVAVVEIRRRTFSSGAATTTPGMPSEE